MDVWDVNPHLAFGLSESSAATERDPWLLWCVEVTKLAGHDLDGDQGNDGYSLDAFYELWEAGRTPAQAVEEVSSFEY